MTLVSSVESMSKSPKNCKNVEGVKNAADHAVGQIQRLAQTGIALPAMYVEYVRQAIDSAGINLLSNPPAADPGARIKWSEAAMSIQLAPLPHFSTAMKGLARSISACEVESLASEVLTAEPVRLLGAVIWVVQPECKCNPSLVEVKSCLIDAPKFVDALQEWMPVRDTSVARLTRARDLLLGIWSWIASGCGGNHTLASLFAWVSLAIAIMPFADMAQRLMPVYKAVKQGVTKSPKTPTREQKLAKAKAWSAALFLLDGPSEAWWWLGLIRPAAHMEKPWVDGEDGGVRESPVYEHGDDKMPRLISKRATVEKMERQATMLEDPVYVGEPGEELGEGELDYDDVSVSGYVSEETEQPPQLPQSSFDNMAELPEPDQFLDAPMAPEEQTYATQAEIGEEPEALEAAALPDLQSPEADLPVGEMES
jgi:hypothetical protein